MDNEAQCLVDNLESAAEEMLFGRRVVRGKFCGEEVSLVVSGIGKSNASAAAQFAIQSGASELVNFGVAGALRPEMRVGELYEIESAVQYDFDLTQINGTRMGTLNEYDTPFLPLRPAGTLPRAVLGSGDRFNDSHDDYLLLTEGLGCSVRDMEGAAIAHVALRAGVPFRSFKCISDVHGNGSTPGQYAENLKKCLEVLTRELPGLANAQTAENMI